jgi:lipopolysaccharide biosynthesis glycosyltransferase
MDLDALRSQGFIEWVRQLTSKDIDGYLDQGIVETFCFSKTEYLPPKYNSLCFLRSLSYRQYLKDYSDFRRLSKKEFYVAQRKPVIVHFNGNIYDRPWHQYSRSKYLFLWRRLHKQVYGKALKPQPFPKTSVKMRMYRRIKQFVAICLPGRFYYWLSNAIGGKRFR